MDLQFIEVAAQNGGKWIAEMQKNQKNGGLKDGEATVGVRREDWLPMNEATEDTRE